MRQGAIIVCGGHSSRMGLDKATLPFGAETLLQRVVRLVGQIVEPTRVVVVSAPGQALPELPQEIRVAHDRVPDRGPLEGLAAGLRELSADVDAAFVISCDAPFLVPAFVSRLFDLLQDNDAAVPLEEGRFHPLAAVYRVSILPRVEQLLAADQRRMRLLYDHIVTRSVPVDLLKAVDPELMSLKNLNHPEEYRAALQRAGFSAPDGLH